jgi:hypothetical protein
MSDGDPPEDLLAARRAFLRAVVYTAPLVVSAVQVNRAAGQTRVSCGPPPNCPPYSGCPPTSGCLPPGHG